MRAASADSQAGENSGDPLPIPTDAEDERKTPRTRPSTPACVSKLETRFMPLKTVPLFLEERKCVDFK